MTVLARTHSWMVVWTEIQKCDVRCANCHQRRTTMRYGWYKAALTVGGR